MGSPDTVLRRLIDEGFSGGRLEVADELIDADVIEHQDYGPGHAPGAEGVKAVIASLRRAFSDFRLEIEDIAVDRRCRLGAQRRHRHQRRLVHGPPAHRRSRCGST